MISSGNRVGFIPSILLFQAQLSLNNSSIHNYQADADTNAPYEATVLGDISPHHSMENCGLYSFSRCLQLHYFSCSKSWSRTVQCLAINNLWLFSYHLQRNQSLNCALQMIYINQMITNSGSLTASYSFSRQKPVHSTEDKKFKCVLYKWL